MKTRRTIRNVALGILSAVLFFVGFRISAVGQLGPLRGGRDSAYLPDYRKSSGLELLVIYLSSSTCGACNDEQLPSLIEQIKVGMAARAAVEGFGFTVVGVGIDWSPQVAFDHLVGFGEFDELVLGNNWLNSAALKYLWQDIPGVPEVPQVVVVQRELQALDQGGPPVAGVFNERLLARHIGLLELRRWLENGLPLPN